MAGRPRRSTASVKSYAIPSLAELDGDNSDWDNQGDNSDADDAAAGPSTSATKPKRTPKVKATVNVKGKGKGKGRVKKARLSSDSGSDFAEELAKQQADELSSETEDLPDEPDDDDDGDAPFDDDSDASGVVIKPATKRGGAGSTKQGAKPKPLNARARQGKATPASFRNAVQLNHPEDSAFSRVTAPPSAYTPTADPELATFGPLYEPPARRLDPATGAVVAGPALNEYQRSLALQDSAERPFFPRVGAQCDLGYNKGKWSVEGGRQNDSWGGWYEPNPDASTRAVDPESVASFLPRNIYPPRPTRVFSDDPPRAPSVTPEGVEGGEMEVDEGDEGEVEVTEVKVSVGLVGNGQDQQELVLQRFESRRIDSYIPRKPGHMFNAGGPVTGLAWCPRRSGYHNEEYLAVSTLSAPLTVRHAPQPMPASIQIWSVDTSVKSDYDRETDDEIKGRDMLREFSLCHHSGEAIELAWCPRGGEPSPEADNLGILAGAFSDGSISLFEIPLSSTANQGDKMGQSGAFVYGEPILRLVLEHTSCLCLSWASHETIAAGCSNGSVVVWSIGDALRTGATDVRPTHVLQPHMAAIRAIAFVLTPPCSATLSSSPDVDGEPEALMTTGHDGSLRLTDLRDGASVNLLNQERGSNLAVAFSAQSGTVLVGDTENDVRAWFLKPASIGSNKVVSQHRGAVWNIAVSDHHVFAVTASADGTCTLANIPRGLRQKSHRVKFAQKLFRLDFSRRTGEYRMLDNLLPQQRTTVDVAKKLKKAGAAKEKDSDKGKGKGKGKGAGPGFENNEISGAWSVEVGVLRAAWFPGLEQARLLASGMACGLVRVDWVDKGPEP